MPDWIATAAGLYAAATLVATAIGYLGWHGAWPHEEVSRRRYARLALTGWAWPLWVIAILAVVGQAIADTLLDLWEDAR